MVARPRCRYVRLERCCLPKGHDGDHKFGCTRKDWLPQVEKVVDGEH